MACSKDELAERHKRLMQLLAKPDSFAQQGSGTKDGKPLNKEMQVEEVTQCTPHTNVQSEKDVDNGQ